MGRTPNNIRSYNRNLSKAREARAKARRDVVREAPGVAEVRGVLFQLIEMAIAESDERFEIDEEIENEEIEASFDDENSDIALAFYDTTQKIDSQDLTLKFLQWNPTAETKVRGNGLRIKQKRRKRAQDIIRSASKCRKITEFYKFYVTDEGNVEAEEEEHEQEKAVELISIPDTPTFRFYTYSCCARKLLSNQPDFKDQKSWLHEVITNRPKPQRIIFYPKFHCELNFIEMVWGYLKAKLRYLCTFNFADLEANVPKLLDAIPSSIINNFVQHCFRFMHGYRVGLYGPVLDFAMKIYKSHRSIPTTATYDTLKEQMKRERSRRSDS